MRMKLQIIMMFVGFGLFMGSTIPLANAQMPTMAPRLPEVQRELPPGTGFVPPQMDLSHLKKQEIPEKFKNLRLPTRWDWREQGKVTPIKDQGNCGSCYAFASLANIESKMLIDSEGTYDFSENNAKECNWYETSCGGGNYYKMANLFSKRGTVLESCDPYVASDVACDWDCPNIKTLLDWRIISTSWIPTTTYLKNYIYTYGPVYTTFYAGDNADTDWRDEFRTYDGSYTLYYPYGEPQNHAVLIVGWDDDLPHDGGTGAWIVKNSWGTDWGGPCGYGAEGGYFTLAYYSANMGGWSSYIYDWQDSHELIGLDFHDEGGWTMSWGYSPSLTAWGLCRFLVSPGVEITRVEFWTTDVTTDIDIYIYDDFDGSNLSNLLASKLNNSFEEAGYHSVLLDSPVEPSWGAYYVVVKFTNESYGYPLPVDDQGLYLTEATYISSSGANGTWYDMGEENQVDICIRAQARALVGACCDESNWTCTDGIYEHFCQPPLRWQWGVTCDEIDPPCEPPPLGACCIEEDCVGTETQAQCEARPGTWYEGEDCIEYQCPVGYQYLPGDVNMALGIWPPTVIGGDVTYLVGYFIGGGQESCLLDDFWASADINGDCLIIGGDVTALVAYFVAGGSITHCPDYEPVWPPLPPTAPAGWPNCDVTVINNLKVIPTGSVK